MYKFVFILLLFTSCIERSDQKDVYGSYVPVGYKNNFDTIQLLPGGIYYRKVYDINRKMLLEMKGKWIFKDNHRVIFYGFYLNLDDSLIRYPKLVNDTEMVMDTYFEKRNQKIGFCVGDYVDQNCYQKIH